MFIIKFLRKLPWFETLFNLIKHLGLYAVSALAGALIFLWCFGELTENLLENEFTNLDSDFGNWVHSFANPLLDTIFTLFTSLGNALGIVILTLVTVGIFVWRKYYFYSWLLLLTVGGGLILNQAMKFLFRRPRPQMWTSVIERPDSFSFPSGHATVAFCYFGLLLWIGLKYFKRTTLRLAWALLMLILIFMIGLSRIYLGVHYLTDVIGGYLSGGFWLLALLGSTSIYRQVRRNGK
ncbi:MAG: phosphatase PAP2 family protein [Chloroflexi bacterium]|uniref:Phosphatase PAP2 family protein n=1 Tax=Candidatus Chlorohelix allophototropha TaxID=3003348 RepID=A0A8T7LWH5_9CHLR|nr:phosphatase PAP2 family protein [Chloroflexota bacterium]WJW67188.1 phosphatase PAP2 family protein [Chloroflexota bacterium L227-S17]